MKLMMDLGRRVQLVHVRNVVDALSEPGMHTIMHAAHRMEEWCCVRKGTCQTELQAVLCGY